MKHFAPIASALAIALIGVSASAKDWVYTDGETAENWSEANPDFAACDAGMMQSPVDLGEHTALGEVALAGDYGPTEGKLKIGSHKIQIDASAGQGMVSGDRLFNLIQVHFHTPSEHAINGERFPLTAHFVHATRDGTLGVLGVMFEEGAPNEGLQTIIDALPNGDGSDIAIDLSSLVPGDLDVYRYMGSLTTPPCSENVNWHVVEKALEASPQQIAAFEEALGMSARSLQPLNNRLLVAPSQ